ncbi:hypothetical protein [Ovoidimarina sediminis]|uniref:hypothetical protein n=1 Tax=Ovoidimarina sediminis TaxID=3079856 RepID=UPI00290F327C|nr:hypothetical protein [Rhodophyticola sp. MJ-SS7]MDU8942873.1 hypothetical protein [Rhodophyticola sp. MJ-SS7]
MLRREGMAGNGTRRTVIFEGMAPAAIEGTVEMLQLQPAVLFIRCTSNASIRSNRLIADEANFAPVFPVCPTHGSEFSY